MDEEKRCIYCGKVPYYAPGTFAKEAGHIYSTLGLKEFKISQLCEYCFDDMFKSEEEEDPYGGDEEPF